MPTVGKSPRGRFKLPTNLTPEGRICFCINLPDDPEHLRIVAGVLNQLTEARNWRGGTELDRDETASMYDEILDDIPWDGACDVPQFRFTVECGLEFSLDGIEWTPVTGWDTFSALCYTGATGAPGAPGAPGADGADGVDGVDGDSLFLRELLATGLEQDDNAGFTTPTLIHAYYRAVYDQTKTFEYDRHIAKRFIPCYVASESQSRTRISA